MRRAKPGNQRPKRVRPPGAVVLQVDPQSAAERAGLKPGDLVTELDGTPVRDAADLQLRLALLRIGEVAEFAVINAGRRSFPPSNHWYSTDTFWPST